MYLMKTPASFEIRTHIIGHVHLNFSGSQTYNTLCQTHRASAAAKTLIFRWHKNFQDGFTNLKDGPGQPKIVLTNANIAAVTGSITRDTKLTV